MGRVSGKVALVTGAASGIGRGAAVALAAEGAKVVVTDVDEAGLKETVDLISKAGGTASAHAQDVTSEERWKEIVAAAKDEFGGLHILVNNAGIGIGTSIFEMSYEDWRRQQAINVDGVFFGVKHGIPPSPPPACPSAMRVLPPTSRRGSSFLLRTSRATSRVRNSSLMVA